MGYGWLDSTQNRIPMYEFIDGRVLFIYEYKR